MHRRDEIDVVHRRRHHMRARMPIGGHRADQIDEVHQSPAEQIAQRVRIVGQDQLRHLAARFGSGAGGQFCGEIHVRFSFRVVKPLFSVRHPPETRNPAQPC